MKIVELRAENIKRLVAVSIAPNGNLVQITGKNGQGKTSVLDAIWWALTGKHNIQTRPVRDGCEQGMIRLDLGEIIVTRTFRAGDDAATTKLTVESKDGGRFPSPQKMLDDLIGDLAFDPLAFCRMAPAGQVAALRAFCPGVDFDAIDRKRQAAYDRRTDFNRRAKDLHAQAQSIELPDKKPEEVDRSSLVEQMKNAGAHNADIEQRRRNRETKHREIDEAKAEVRKAEAIIAQRQAFIDEWAPKLDSAAPLPEPLDLDSLSAQLNTADAVSRIRAAFDDRATKTDAARMLEGEAKDLTNEIDALDRQKAQAIANAKLPVSGLSFTSDGVQLDGIPFDQASDAQQLRASIGIAMAMNPKLRVIRVRDGSLLDEESMRILDEMADGQDYQVWIERVDSSGKVGFVIDDGHIHISTKVNKEEQ